MAMHRQEFEQLLVHTGQPAWRQTGTTATERCCYNISKVFFEDLELPQADIYLDVGRSAPFDGLRIKRSRRKGIALTYPWIEAQVKTARKTE